MTGPTSRIDKIEYSAVILAAGRGRRAGGYKPLWRIGKDGQDTVIDYVIKAATSVCSRIRIVGGFAFDRLTSHIESLRNDRIELIYNPQWERGMFSSVQAGLNRVNTPVFVHPADIFKVSPKVYIQLAEQVIDLHSRLVIRPTFGDRTGHPVLLMPSVIRKIRESSADANLREILLRFHPKHDIRVDDESILKDFDTADEFRELTKGLSKEIADGSFTERSFGHHRGRS